MKLGTSTKQTLHSSATFGTPPFDAFDMKLLNGIVVTLLSLPSAAVAASSWTFEDATLTIQGKGSGVGGGVKEK